MDSKPYFELNTKNYRLIVNVTAALFLVCITYALYLYQVTAQVRSLNAFLKQELQNMEQSNEQFRKQISDNAELLTTTSTVSTVVASNGDYSHAAGMVALSSYSSISDNPYSIVRVLLLTLLAALSIGGLLFLHARYVSTSKVHPQLPRSKES